MLVFLRLLGTVTGRSRGRLGGHKYAVEMVALLKKFKGRVKSDLAKVSKIQCWYPTFALHRSTLGTSPDSPPWAPRSFPFFSSPDTPEHSSLAVL